MALVCFFSGAIIGFFSGILGIGGGLIIIPLLGLLLGFSQQLAQGTALIVVLPAVLVTLYKYNQYNRLNVKAVIYGGMASMAMTWFGAKIALGLDPVLLRKIYAGFVLLIALFYLHGSTRPVKKTLKGGDNNKTINPNPMWFLAIGSLAGLIGGIFGVGGAVFTVPLFGILFAYTQTKAQGIALSMVVPSNIVALITYSAHGQSDWLIGISLALGSVIFVPYGVRLAHALPEPRLKLIFACMMLLILVLLLQKV